VLKLIALGPENIYRMNVRAAVEKPQGHGTKLASVFSDEGRFVVGCGKQTQR
jgi:hypothetical protein